MSRRCRSRCPEDLLDVADQGSFYDAVGALRDVVQNHLMQVLSMVAMEPPSGPRWTPSSTTASGTCSKPCGRRSAHCVRGQYEGYRDVEGVAPDSTTETASPCGCTSTALAVAGCPAFFLRAGKCMPEKITEVRIVFQRAPTLHFAKGKHRCQPNQFVLRIDPDAGASMVLHARDADDSGLRESTSTWTSRVRAAPGARALRGDPLSAALRGDQSNFTRRDSIGGDVADRAAVDRRAAGDRGLRPGPGGGLPEPRR